MRRRKKQWLGFLVMVVGVCLLMGPFVAGDLQTMKQESIVQDFRNAVQQPTAAPTTAPTAAPAPADAPADPTTEATEAPTAEPTEAVPTDDPVTEQPDTTDEPTAEPAVQTPTATPAAEQPVSTETSAAATPAPTAADTVFAVPETPDATAEPTPQPIATATPTAEPTATVTPTVKPTVTPTAEPDDDFFRDAMAYNQSLVEHGQWNMDTLSDLERFQLDARKYGYPENMIGTISIPRLDVEVALFLGATEEHMGNGFAVFGMTSLPLGLGEENVAIAGHRGWRGADMLRNVQMLLIGDPIYITTPWRTLTYTVSGIEIVTPKNLNWCKLKPGKTMISLMTCHPYGQHTHRYIVYAELQEDEPEAEPTPTASPEPTGTPTAVPTATASPEPTAAAVTESPAPSMAAETAEPTQAAAESTAVTPLAATETPQPAMTAEPTATATAAPTASPEPTATATAAPTASPEPTATATAEPTAAATATAEPTAAPTQSTVQEITLVHDDGTRETIMIETTALAPDDSEYSTVWSNTLILAEDSMRPVAYVTAGVVALVGLWLLIATIRDARKEKRGKRHDEE